MSRRDLTQRRLKSCNLRDGEADNSVNVAFQVDTMNVDSADIGRGDRVISLFRQQALVSAVIAVITFVVAASRINPGLSESQLPDGPGLTLDEPFNIGQGVYLAESLGHHGPLILTPSVARRVFGSPNYLPDHPPLGRLILGIAHESAAWLIAGAETAALNVPAARLGSCFLFAVLAALVCEWSRRQFDLLTGVTASAFLVLMPQFTGHARLATLETATAFAWFAALVPLLSWWTQAGAPGSRQAIVSGLIFGLLMLTKMQAILLPPLVVVWSLWRFRSDAFRPLLCWGVAGLLVFFVFWPWLWLDPYHHLRQYLGSAADRQVLYVWYFGMRYADKMVPWHFPFVMTLITVPAFIVPCFLNRVIVRHYCRVEQLLLASVAWPLVVFSLPGTPVYDGTRLFLCVMPPLAILAARGFLLLLQLTRIIPPAMKAGPAFQNDSAIPVPKSPFSFGRKVVLIVTSLLIVRAMTSGAVFSPYAIGEYSDLVGGARGAQRLGMEASYWADGLNGEFWKSVPPQTTVFVAPVSHQFQLHDLETLVPVIRKRGIRLVAFRYDSSQQKGLLLLLHRMADLRPSMQGIPNGAQVVAEVRHDGVVLARLIDTTRATWVEKP